MGTICPTNSKWADFIFPMVKTMARAFIIHVTKDDSEHRDKFLMTIRNLMSDEQRLLEVSFNRKVMKRLKPEVQKRISTTRPGKQTYKPVKEDYVDVIVINRPTINAAAGPLTSVERSFVSSLNNELTKLSRHAIGVLDDVPNPSRRISATVEAIIKLHRVSKDATQVLIDRKQTCHKYLVAERLRALGPDPSVDKVKADRDVPFTTSEWMNAAEFVSQTDNLIQRLKRIYQIPPQAEVPNVKALVKTIYSEVIRAL